MDYKDVLRKRADELNELLVRYQHEVSSGEKDRIIGLIKEIYNNTTGILDAKEYHERDKDIMVLHSKLNSAMLKFRILEAKENREQTETREDI